MISVAEVEIPDAKSAASSSSILLAEGSEFRQHVVLSDSGRPPDLGRKLCPRRAVAGHFVSVEVYVANVSRVSLMSHLVFV